MTSIATTDGDPIGTTDASQHQAAESRPKRSSRNQNAVYDKRIHPGLDPHIRPAVYERLTGEEAPTRGRRYSTPSGPDAQISRSSPRSSDEVSLQSLSDDEDIQDIGITSQDVRQPDPKATRRSARVSTGTPPLYDMSKHPQDKELRLAMLSPLKRKRKDTRSRSRSQATTSPSLEEATAGPSMSRKKSRQQRVSTETLDDSAVVITDSKRAGGDGTMAISSSTEQASTDDDDDDDVEEDNEKLEPDGRLSNVKEDAPSAEADLGGANNHREVEHVQFEEDDTSARDDLEAAGVDDDSGTAPVEASNAAEPSVAINTDHQMGGRNNVPGQDDQRLGANDDRQFHEEQRNDSRDSPPIGARWSFQDKTLAPGIDLESERFHKATAEPASESAPHQANDPNFASLIAFIDNSGLSMADVHAMLVSHASQQPLRSTTDSFAAPPGLWKDSATPQSSAQSNFTALSSSAPPIGSQDQRGSQDSSGSGQARPRSHRRSTKGKPATNSQPVQGSQTRMTGKRSGLNIRPDLGDGSDANDATGKGSSSQRTSLSGSQRVPSNQSRMSQASARSGSNTLQTPEPEQNAGTGDDSASTLSAGDDDMDGLSAIGTK
ncbi:Hypothetical protein D9617_3g018860 [Elsinoe fawcettii]|nr:Hypothetical protein D9617_3g018860 [Elsinoe fawcettii]